MVPVTSVQLSLFYGSAGWLVHNCFERCSVLYIPPPGSFVGRNFSSRDSIRDPFYYSRIERVWPEFVVSTAKSACNNGASHVNHRQTPHPRLHAFAVCVFLLYSLTNVPYRCLAVYCISNAANALRYTEFPFRVNPMGERNCTYLEFSFKKKIGDVSILLRLHLCVYCRERSINRDKCGEKYTKIITETNFPVTNRNIEYENDHQTRMKRNRR